MEVTKTPEELQNALTTEQNKNKQLEQERDTERAARGKAEQTLREANTKAEQLAQEAQTERAAHTKTKSELADANKLVDDLTEQLSEPAGPKAHTATIGSGASAQTYRFVVPQFYFDGHKVKAEEVKNNSDVLKALVKAGAKVIELVPAK